MPVFHRQQVQALIEFDTDKLGFELQFKKPEQNPVFAIIGRDDAMLFLKAGNADPLPNARRNPAMRRNAYCYAPDLDRLAAEFTERRTLFSTALKDTKRPLDGSLR